MTGALIDERLLVLDHAPWYDTTPDHRSRVDDVLGWFTRTVVGPDELSDMTDELARALLRPGDVVVTPLMSGALLLPALEPHCARLGVPLLLLPLSRHPFVTLSCDSPDDLRTYCAGYERTGAVLPALPAQLRALVADGARRVVLVDSNSATGRDAVLLRALCRRWTEHRVDFAFGVLVNEVGDDDRIAPGWRGGPKAMSPDACAVRLRGRNARYLSHLRFLGRAWDEQVDVARRIRAEFPDLTVYWDSVPGDLAGIHGHRSSELTIHRERLHVRFGPDETEDVADRLRASLAELDRLAPSVVTAAARRRREESLRRWPATVAAGSGGAGTR